MVGLFFAFIAGSFKRNVSTSDAAQSEMKSDIKQILIELGKVREEQVRQEGKIAQVLAEVAVLKRDIGAAHRRIDNLKGEA